MKLARHAWAAGLAWRNVLGREPRRILFALTCGAMLAVCLIVASIMWDAHESAGRDAAVSARNLAAAVAHDVDRNIELVELSIKAVAASWTKPAVQALSPELRHMVLFDSASSAEGLGPLIVVDVDGFIKETSRPLAKPMSYLGDRDFFRVHVASEVGLFVSKPFLSRISGRWMVGLSRRIDNPDGSFGGVVVGTVELAYLSRLYGALDLGRDGSITLFRTDGTVITRAPYVEDDVHRFLGATDGFNRIRPLRSGSFEGPSPVDGADRIVSFHRVGNLPLIQVVEVSPRQAYADWWRKALVIGGALGTMCLSTLALMLMLDAELVRRAGMEASLARLATTDHLTGLANRRRFVEALAMEWARARRDGSELSILMIDADRFKAYNDAFGHLAGDELLKGFAGCMLGVRHPGAVASRYGGEEFTLLLPNVGSLEACAIAELVRTAVVDLARPHPGSTERIATVSIGVATTRPAFGESSDRLVAAADAALYRAKSDGRNRCRAAPIRLPNHRAAA